MMAGPAWLAAAVPVRTKMPVPITAPTPSSVRSHAVKVRRSALPPLSTSLTSCSIDFVFSRFESIEAPSLLGAAVGIGEPIIAGDPGARVAAGEEIRDHGDARRAGGPCRW